MTKPNTSTTRADDWVAWLDNTPIKIEFHAAIISLQGFISALATERDAAIARAEQAEARVTELGEVKRQAYNRRNPSHEERKIMKDFINWVKYDAPAWAVVVIFLFLFAIGSAAAGLLIIVLSSKYWFVTTIIPITAAWAVLREYKKSKKEKP
jgi:Flp pilus assembly protein TadB